MDSQHKHALVFGASGISGWSTVNELLGDYPTKGIWGRVTALSNRPLTHQASGWPQDDRLCIVSGIDLLEGSQQQLEESLKSKVPCIDSVTHVYYYAYKAQTDLRKEIEDAVDMLARSITAIDHLSQALQFVLLQTGTKLYGFFLEDDHYFPVPLHESLPRLKQPWYDTLFYYPQCDWMCEYSKTRNWTWAETRPDSIIGFVPNFNAHSIAELLAVYFSLWVKVYGKGSDVPFPGNEGTWMAKHNEAGADILARQSIHLSLRPNSCGAGQAFNVASNPKWQTWKMKWPQLAGYFGLNGVPPGEDKKEIRRFIHDHLEEWKELEQEYNLKPGVATTGIRNTSVLVGVLELANFDRQLDLTKIQNTGFLEEESILDTWGRTFLRMRETKIIP